MSARTDKSNVKESLNEDLKETVKLSNQLTFFKFMVNLLIDFEGVRGIKPQVTFGKLWSNWNWNTSSSNFHSLLWF